MDNVGSRVPTMAPDSAMDVRARVMEGERRAGRERRAERDERGGAVVEVMVTAVSGLAAAASNAVGWLSMV